MRGLGCLRFGIFGIAPNLQDIAGKLIRFDCFYHPKREISPLLNFVYMFFIFISYGYPSFQSYFDNRVSI